HEDDQQHQHDVHHRGHVDVGVDLTPLVPYCHRHSFILRPVSPSFVFLRSTPADPDLSRLLRMPFACGIRRFELSFSQGVSSLLQLSICWMESGDYRWLCLMK